MEALVLDRGNNTVEYHPDEGTSASVLHRHTAEIRLATFVPWLSSAVYLILFAALLDLFENPVDNENDGKLCETGYDTHREKVASRARSTCK